jgi:rsbT co-antagonist protein RsbR
VSTTPEDASQDALRAENTQLRAQVAELTRDVERLGRDVERLSRWRMLAQATLDASPDLIFVRDTDFRYAVINKACEEYVKLPSEQILGREDADLFPPALIEEFRANDRQILSTLRVSIEEQVVPRPDGPHTYVNRKFPVFVPGGEIVAIGGISTDITARRRAEASLRESQTLLQALLEYSPSLIVVKDPEGRYLVMNRQAERALRCPANAALGKTDFELFAPDDASRLVSRHKHVLMTGAPTEGEETVTMPGGARIYFTSTFPLRDAQGSIYATCGLITDVTDLRRQEEERARHREEVIQAQQSALRELSTPLIPFAEQVVIMPLIGSIDSVRAQQALETLLHGTARHRASVAVVDITGVPDVDADVAHALIRAAKAVELLGAKTILTGIRPDVARTLAELSIDLGGIVTQGTLQSGVAYALAAARGHVRGSAI